MDSNTKNKVPFFLELYFGNLKNVRVFVFAKIKFQKVWNFILGTSNTKKIKFQHFWNYILGTSKKGVDLAFAEIDFQNFWNSIFWIQTQKISSNFFGTLFREPQKREGFCICKNKVPKLLELYFWNLKHQKKSSKKNGTLFWEPQKQEGFFH